MHDMIVSPIWYVRYDLYIVCQYFPVYVHPMNIKVTNNGYVKPCNPEGKKHLGNLKK